MPLFQGLQPLLRGFVEASWLEHRGSRRGFCCLDRLDVLDLKPNLLDHGLHLLLCHLALGELLDLHVLRVELLVHQADHLVLFFEFQLDLSQIYGWRLRRLLFIIFDFANLLAEVAYSFIKLVELLLNDAELTFQLRVDSIFGFLISVRLPLQLPLQFLNHGLELALVAGWRDLVLRLLQVRYHRLPNQGVDALRELLNFSNSLYNLVFEDVHPLSDLCLGSLLVFNLLIYRGNAGFQLLQRLGEFQSYQVFLGSVRGLLRRVCDWPLDLFLRVRQVRLLHRTHQGPFLADLLPLHGLDVLRLDAEARLLRSLLLVHRSIDGGVRHLAQSLLFELTISFAVHHEVVSRMLIRVVLGVRLLAEELVLVGFGESLGGLLLRAFFLVISINEFGRGTPLLDPLVAGRRLAHLGEDAPGIVHIFVAGYQLVLRLLLHLVEDLDLLRLLGFNFLVANQLGHVLLVGAIRFIYLKLVLIVNYVLARIDSQLAAKQLVVAENVWSHLVVLLVLDTRQSSSHDAFNLLIVARFLLRRPLLLDLLCLHHCNFLDV